VWKVFIMWLTVGISVGGAFSSEIPLVEGWRYTFGDNPLYTSMEYDDSSWKMVNFPTTTFEFLGEENPYTWFRKRFVLPSSFTNRKMGLYTGRIHDAVEVYCNGILIGISGSQPPRHYFGTPHAPRGFLVAPEILHEGTNLIALRVYTHKKQGSFGEMALAPYEEVVQRVRWESFLGLGIPQIVTIVSVFMLVYFLFLFGKSGDRSMLYVGIGVFLLGCYYTDIYVEYLPIEYLLKQKIAFACLYASFAFLVPFFHRIYAIQRRWIEAVGFLLAGISVVADFLMPDFPAWELIMGSVVQLAWVLPVTLYILGVNLWAVIRKKNYALLMFLGSFLAIFFSLKDSFGFMLHLWARYWTSSWGMLLFSFSMFISMALRAADIQKLSQQKEKELGKQKEHLQLLLQKIRGVVIQLGETSGNLDQEIASSQVAVEYMVDLSQKMRAEFENEIHALEESTKLTLGLVTEIDGIMRRLSEENLLIQKGMKRFQDILVALKDVSLEVKNLRELSIRLKEGMEISRTQTASSRTSLLSLTQKAENVFVLLGNIQKIADDTNTLAINAAIQSAHAGEYGKSFAIVGQEVRNLAMSVAKLADNVTDEVQSMNAELEETQSNFETLEKHLEEIMTQMDTLDALMTKLSTTLEQQHTDSTILAENVEDLGKVMNTLVSAFDEQKQKVSSFYQMLQNVQKILSEFVKRLDAQQEKQEKVLGFMNRLVELSQKNKEIMMQLSRFATEEMTGEIS